MIKVSYVCRYCHAHFTIEREEIGTPDLVTPSLHFCHPIQAPNKRGVCDVAAIEEVEA